MKDYIAYHGTKTANAQRIMKTNFISNTKKIGWLGSGSYHFQENENLAREWAVKDYPNNYKVIRSELSIPEDKLLDTTDPYGEGAKLYQAWANRIIPNLAKRGKNLEVPRDKITGHIYNMVCQQEKFDAVRAFTHTYTNIERQYKIATHVPNGIEICIRNNYCIKNKKII